VAGSELVFAVRRLAADGLEARQQWSSEGTSATAPGKEASVYDGGATRRWLKVRCQAGWLAKIGGGAG
jgi:hypothetical protein